MKFVHTLRLVIIAAALASLIIWAFGGSYAPNSAGPLYEMIYISTLFIILVANSIATLLINKDESYLSLANRITLMSVLMFAIVLLAPTLATNLLTSLE